MQNPATPADVTKRWRSLNPQETVNAETFLADAWRMVRRNVPDIATRLDAGTPAADDLRADVVQVLAQAALRVLKNLDGSKRESADDVSWEPDQAAASGLLEITPAEYVLLRPAATTYAAPGVYVVGLGG